MAKVEITMTIENRIEIAQAKWDQIQNKYGSFEIIDDPKNLPKIDKKRIWTEFWGQDQFISNTYLEVEVFDGDITSYYIFEKPYTEDEDSVNLITTFWDDCDDCGGEDEDCENCEGRGTVAIEVI